jgi:hypothetical protein
LEKIRRRERHDEVFQQIHERHIAPAPGGVAIGAPRVVLSATCQIRP